MEIDARFSRHVRITGSPDNLAGWAVTIVDVETGEEIVNVVKAVITLIPGEVNQVELFYDVVDLLKTNGYRRASRIVQHPEIDLTAEHWLRPKEERGKTE